MTYRMFRGTVFLCLLMTLAISLTGCADAFKGVLDLVKGVADTVKNVFGKINDVVKPVTAAVKAGTDAVNAGKAIVDTVKGVTTGDSKTTGNRTVKNPDEEDTTSGTGGTKPSAGAGTTTGTKPAGTPAEAASNAAKAQELKAKVAQSKESVTKQIGEITKIINALPANSPHASRLKEAVFNLTELNKYLDKVVAGEVKTQTELDRYQSALDAIAKDYQSQAAYASYIISLIPAAETKAQEVIKSISWVGSLFGGTTGTKPPPKGPLPANPPAVAPKAPNLAGADAVMTALKDFYTYKATSADAKAKAEKLMGLLSNAKDQATVRSIYKEFQGLNSSAAVTDRDIRNAVAFWNADRTDKMDPNKLSAADLAKLAEGQYIARKPGYWDELHQTSVTGAKSLGDEDDEDPEK